MDPMNPMTSQTTVQEESAEEHHQDDENNKASADDSSTTTRTTNDDDDDDDDEEESSSTTTAGSNSSSISNSTIRRTVTFRPLVSIQEGLHISDFTPSEKYACYYSREEYKEMRKDIRYVLKVYTNSPHLFLKDSNSKNFCLRGLEDKLHQQRQKDLRSAARLAVFSEQQIQQELCVTNESMIRNVYMEYSYRCAEDARQRGIDDERLVGRNSYQKKRNFDNIILRRSNSQDRFILSAARPATAA